MVLTQESVRELFDYVSETGELKWKVRKAYCIKIGDIAGGLNHKGYREVHINSRIYQVHRVIWFWIVGEWPKNEIDHIDGDSSNNRCYLDKNHPLNNLREATHSQNIWNSRKHNDNTSGYKNVNLFKIGKYERWRVEFRKNKKRCYSKLFAINQFKEACLHADEMRLKICGEFARHE